MEASYPRPWPGAAAATMAKRANVRATRKCNIRLLSTHKFSPERGPSGVAMARKASPFDQPGVAMAQKCLPCRLLAVFWRSWQRYRLILT